jgi:LacI family transcriptional regulator
VARAVRFIRQRAKEAITVDDVVWVAAVSRRGLERRFQRVLNRSVLDEIRRVHIELVTRMLIETSLSVTQIASSLGYTSVAHIGRYFRREGNCRKMVKKLRKMVLHKMLRRVII